MHLHVICYLRIHMYKILYFIYYFFYVIYIVHCTLIYTFKVRWNIRYWVKLRLSINNAFIIFLQLEKKWQNFSKTFTKPNRAFRWKTKIYKMQVFNSILSFNIKHFDKQRPFDWNYCNHVALISFTVYEFDCVNQ